MPAPLPKIEIQRPFPASNGVKMNKSHLYFAAISDKTKGSIKEISESDYSISYDYYVEEGKYDVEAFFTDKEGRFYNANYLYIEKIN